MFVYNITIKVDNEILHQWITWIKEEYIPAVMATDLFNESKFFELVDPDDDAESSTFVLQYFTHLKENYHIFSKHHAKSFHQKSLEKWKDNFIAFSTLMRTVH